VGVDVADWYWADFDTQLVSSCNLYPLFYWILETALINSLIIYQGHPVNLELTGKHFDFHSCIMYDLVQAASSHQQNVKWFGGHNSNTKLFWTATPILPDALKST
jgi:hypothetical protein